MTVKIESDVPITPQKSFNRVRYPIFDMKPGDSFFVACENAGELARCRSKVSSAARYAGIAITSRRVDGGIRFWRLGDGE